VPRLFPDWQERAALTPAGSADIVRAMRVLLIVIAVGMTTLTTFTTPFTAPFQNAPQSQLRVFIRSGPKTHGPGAHDHPRFLKEWVALLNARGASATGGDAFPTKAQLDETDVLVLHAPEAGNITDPADRTNLSEFLGRGGGLVVIAAGGEEEARARQARQGEEAAARINNWVKDETRGRIPNLIAPDSLNGDTALVVTNAVYFLGDWTTPFNASNTRDEPLALTQLILLYHLIQAEERMKKAASDSGS